LKTILNRSPVFISRQKHVLLCKLLYVMCIVM